MDGGIKNLDSRSHPRTMIVDALGWSSYGARMVSHHFESNESSESRVAAAFNWIRNLNENSISRAV